MQKLPRPTAVVTDNSSECAGRNFLAVQGICAGESGPPRYDTCVVFFSLCVHRAADAVSPPAGAKADLAPAYNRHITLYGYIDPIWSQRAL